MKDPDYSNYIHEIYFCVRDGKLTQLKECLAEALAAGKPVSLGLAEAFAQAVKEDINPRDSWRAAKDFRMHIAVESAKRAFLESVKLAGGEV